VALLEVKELRVYYGQKPAVRGVSFKVERGEVFCLVGESGSGKSSVFYAIMRLLPPYARVSGSVKLEGKELLTLTEREMRKVRGKEVGMVFQEPSLYLDPLFPVGEQIKETYEAHFKAGEREAYEAVIRAMRKAGIPEPERRYRAYPHQLSGGLKQRVCIANAIVCEPKLVLADEPTTALDVTLQRKILALFRKLKEENKAVVLITHDFGVVAEAGDRVAVMKEGKIVEEGPVERIFDRPSHPYTRRLLSAL